MINKFISLSVLILSLSVLCNCRKKSEDPKPNNTLVFEDNFDNNGFLWEIIKNDSLVFKVENGHYTLEQTKTNNPDYSIIGSFNDFVKNDFNKNFKLEAKFDKVSNSDWGKGLIWGVDSSWNDLNFFIINDLGYYKIYRYANSQITVYKDWTL